MKTVTCCGPNDSFHQAHGADMSKCDAWRCDCGNTVSAQGFYPCNIAGQEIDGDGEFYKCDSCKTMYRPDGIEEHFDVILQALEVGAERQHERTADTWGEAACCEQLPCIFCQAIAEYKNRSDLLLEACKGALAYILSGDLTEKMAVARLRAAIAMKKGG